MSNTGRDPYRGLLDMMRRQAAAQTSSAFVVGKILEITKETIRIQADGHELDEQDILINAALIPDFEETADLTVEAGGMDGTCVLSGSAACAWGAHSAFTITGMSSGRMKSAGVYHVEYRLKAGDLVMLMPDADRQLYYLVCKVVRYGVIPTD